MFKKIVIANRGEIAVRIMATCREMGIQTVAVYSEADRNARHVRTADEVYPVGPAPATQSYLRMDAILDIARQSGAEAIHPGYGFLSENVAFVEACEQAGVIFIGPSAPAMRLMGSKIAAKQLAQSVGVPTIPGYAGESQDDSSLMSEAHHIGFPLLIKAAAGGGGKGMREVHTATTFLEELAGARREARTAFGDETVFLERLIQQPRHVEVQILADNYGNVISLGERECSIQRRHQKILEESPSVALTPALRAKMGSAAVRIAKAAGYSNAGTIEFLLDTDKCFYFLEMNTRLQVEHPVTELVTGLDVVRHQLLIAAGEPLSITQEQVSPRGHAIEVRIYAEDPMHNFFPSPGIMQRFVEPRGPGIRVDSGVEDGDEITQFYDPMIAKLIVYAENRPAAVERLQRALEQSALFGVTTNIPLLHAVTLQPAFREGLTHTGFLNEHGLTEIGAQQDIPKEALIAAAIYDLKYEVVVRGAKSTANEYSQPLSINPWKMLGPWRMVGETYILTYSYQEKKHRVALLPKPCDQADTWNIQVDAQKGETITCMIANNDGILLRYGAIQKRAYVRRDRDETHVVLDGYTYSLQRRRPPDVGAATRDSERGHVQKILTAPMAGTIVKVQVCEGETVQPQQVLVILSAMKMEHSIIAPHEGKVRRVLYEEGAVVQGGAVVIELE